MRGKLIILLVLMGILWGIKAPMWAAVFYTWVTLFRPLDFTYAPLPTLVPIAFAVLVISIIVRCTEGSVKLKWNIGVFYLVLIIVVSFISACFSTFPGIAWESFVTVVKIILPSILISTTISTEKGFKLMVSTCAISIGVWAIQAAIHGTMSGGAATTMKIGGQMSDRNDFAVGVLMTWPFFYYLGLNEKKKQIKRMLLVGSFFVGLCAIVSNSRGAMLGLILILFMNFMRKGTKRFRNLLTIILIIPLLIPLIPQYAIDRMNTIEVGAEQKEGSAKSRTKLMKAGISATLDYPAFGVGTGCWPANAYKYVPGGNIGGANEPHCIWIKIGAELGFAGLGVYLMMFWRIIASLRRIQKKCLKIGRIDYYNYSYMLQLSLFGYCSAGTFINQLFYEYMFLVIATAGAFIGSWESYSQATKDKNSIMDVFT